MTRRGVFVAAMGVLLGAVLAGLGSWWAARRPHEPRRDAPAPTPSARAPIPHVAITLFDPSPDADTLVPVQIEIPASPNAIDHGRLVVEAALERATRPAVALWPPGTTLRTWFVTPGGGAIIDLTGLPADGLGGGTTAERLAVLALVAAVRANVPGASSVRLLVEGQVSSTLAGHLDLRAPLAASDRALEPTAP
ncbi:MAG: GerMN domain-containing protein [Vicinamibacterales bacterium]